MKISIGFKIDKSEKVDSNVGGVDINELTKGVNSLVDVYFPERNLTHVYYNNLFDLVPGDTVYVEGKLEGMAGRVMRVNRSFKIKLSDYKKVITKVDTDIHGKLNLCGGDFISFERNVIPYSKIITWFKEPANGEEEFITGEEISRFPLNDLSKMNAWVEIVIRGEEYHDEGRVRYLCLDGVCGRAIVEGTHPYEVEFEYEDGEIRNLNCNCFCSYYCKHDYAAMLKLRETFEAIQKHYGEEFEESGYFAILDKKVLVDRVLSCKHGISICFE